MSRVEGDATGEDAMKERAEPTAKWQGGGNSWVVMGGMAEKVGV